MEEFLIFSNPGKLDLNFIKLMGVSVKETDSAIGFFGTGLKYAIATILRNNGELRIYMGDEFYQFKTKDLELRGKSFQQILMNDEPLPFTTELGKQWEPWMAIRELYSNALDEGGDMSYGNVMPRDDGNTHIVVWGAEFIDAYNERRRYFISKDEEPLLTTPFADVYAQVGAIPDSAFYYKGIKVGEFSAPGKYRYNFKCALSLTEDRTSKYSFEIKEALEKTILSSNNAEFIRSCLVSKDVMEAALSFGLPYTYLEPSRAFVELVESLSVTRPRDFNLGAQRWLDRRNAVQRKYVPVAPTKIQAKQIEKSLECLRKMGYAQEVDLYPLRVTTSLGEGIMGQALDGVMWISRDAFDNGTKYVCSTILEEFVHLKLGYADYTRQLQTWLFDRIVSMAEDYVLGEPL